MNIKVSLLGNGGVGKTSIKQMFTDHTFEEDYNATIGTDFTVKDYDYSSGARHAKNISYMI